MKTTPIFAAALLALVSGTASAQAEAKPQPKVEPKPAAQPSTQPAPKTDATPAKDTSMETPTDPAYVLNYTVDDIDGKPVKLDTYKGKVLLIVNVASRCGYTVQYEAMEKLYKEKHDQGFEILAFPANDFMSQEPGTNAEIKSFCTSKYSVTFPMFSKISVKGEKSHPLYKQIASLPKPVGEEPGWNFTKYLVDRSGHVVARFASAVKPDDKALIAKVNELLAAK